MTLNGVMAVSIALFHWIW